jgi:hypothetical protein
VAGQPWDERAPGPAARGGVAADREVDGRHALRSSLATIIPAAAAPYGYTLAIWSCGAVLLRSDGTPSLTDTLIFVGGAIVGFNLFGLLAIGVIGEAKPIGSPQERVLAGVLDWVALAVVVAAVSGISHIHGWEAWLLGPFAATVLYLLAASAQLAVLAIHRGVHRGDGPATGRDQDTHRAAR